MGGDKRRKGGERSRKGEERCILLVRARAHTHTHLQAVELVLVKPELGKFHVGLEPQALVLRTLQRCQRRIVEPAMYVCVCVCVCVCVSVHNIHRRIGAVHRDVCIYTDA